MTEQWKKYMKNGEEIYQKYCSSNTAQPTMFPRAPIQTYIDLYPDTAVFRDEIQRQCDYEAEVKVYRALERLTEKLIVLHNFKFNHHQYCLCDTEHKRDRKKCNKCRNQFNTEGECDFLVIWPDLCCFVIIEVKNMAPINYHLDPLQTVEDYKTDDSSLDDLEIERKLQALVKTFRKSTAQRKKITSLIKCINENARILQFTAYPNFSNQFRNQFQFSKNQELRLCDGELSTVIFQEDFRDQELPSSIGNDTQTSKFQDWWTRNIAAQMKSTEAALDEGKPTSPAVLEYHSESIKMVRNMLLAIWATEKNDCDQSKCSLGHSIIEINKQLEHGLITLETKEGKHRERNFNVTKAPDVFREYVGVEYLTTEQLKVFNSEENLTWINGPAGAGKTVVLCAKLLQLVLSKRHGDGKVVVIQMAAREETSLFEQALIKAGIQFGVIKSDGLTSSPARLEDSISRSQDKIVLVKIIDHLLLIQLFVEKLNAAKDCYLLVDDLQRVLQFSTEETFRDLVVELKTFSLNRRVWIGCDLLQAYHMLDYKPNIMGEARVILQNLEQWNTLSVNLRNTFELSNTLSVIRELCVQSCVERSQIIDTIMPMQISGHFIHGPKIELHILSKYDATIIRQIVEEEQEKLERLDTMTNLEMCLLYDPAFSELVHEIKPKRKVMIEKIYSYEWPAVIALLSIWKHGQWELPQLYLTISRARVYCSVMIIAPKGVKVEDFENLQDLLRKLKDFVRIFYH